MNSVAGVKNEGSIRHLVLEVRLRAPYQTICGDFIYHAHRAIPDPILNFQSISRLSKEKTLESAANNEFIQRTLNSVRFTDRQSHCV
jgi:hypothetical protein